MSDWLSDQYRKIAQEEATAEQEKREREQQQARMNAALKQQEQATAQERATQYRQVLIRLQAERLLRDIGRSEWRGGNIQWHTHTNHLPDDRYFYSGYVAVALEFKYPSITEAYASNDLEPMEKVEALCIGQDHYGTYIKSRSGIPIHFTCDPFDFKNDVWHDERGNGYSTAQAWPRTEDKGHIVDCDIQALQLLLAEDCLLRRKCGLIPVSQRAEREKLYIKHVRKYGFDRTKERVNIRRGDHRYWWADYYEGHPSK